MNVDIVGTLSQTTISLYAIIFGAIISVVCLILRLTIKRNKIATIICDLLSSFLFGLSNILFCLYFTQGVFYFYTLLTFSLGFSLSFYTLLSIYRRVNHKLTRKKIEN